MKIYEKETTPVSYGEAKLRIIKSLSNDFFKDYRNREALNLMIKMFDKEEKKIFDFFKPKKRGNK